MRSAALSRRRPCTGVAVIAYEVAERLARRLGDPPEDRRSGVVAPRSHRDTVMGSTETSAARFFCSTRGLHVPGGFVHQTTVLVAMS